jgi:phage FluMu gp28-like protein
MVEPLYALCTQYRRGKAVAWTDKTIEQFEKVKQQIISCPKLYWMDDNLPVFLHTDASDYGIGAYLFQVDSDGKERPIRFLSKALNAVQSRWSTIEKECYAIFYAFKELEYLIRDRKFTLRTDHRNLLFLNGQPSQKVTRWKLAIQEYDFDIEHTSGRDNVVADTWSRLCDDGKRDDVSLSQATVALCLSYVGMSVRTPGTMICCSTGVGG